MVRDEDHGALLDRHRDPLRDRLRPLLPRLHVLPTLSERPGDTVVRIGAGDSVSDLAARVAPEGVVLVVDRSVDALERLRTATTASNVFYLVGSMDVLPLTDDAADEILASSVPNPDAAAEFFRVLRCGGEVVVATADQEPTRPALNVDVREIERLFTDAGFTAVTVAAAEGRLAVAARKP